MTRKDFPKELRRFRLKLLLSQYRLSKEVGVSHNTITNIERGITKPSYKILHKLKSYAASIGEHLNTNFTDGD